MRQLGYAFAKGEGYPNCLTFVFKVLKKNVKYIKIKRVKNIIKHGGNMRKKANLRMIRNLILFIGLIILTFFLLFKDQDIGELFNIVRSANPFFILLGIGLMLVYYLIEAHNVRSILKNFGEKISLLNALKFTWIGFFFSAITPAASGGQPVEIYYMTKENISGPHATMALLMQLCGFQISTISLGIICAIINPGILQGGLIWLFLIGVLINSVALALMLICIFSKRLTKGVINSFIKILKLFRVKKLELKRKKIEEGLAKYNQSAVYIKSHKLEFIKAILRVFVQICVYYSIPFCVYKAFGLNSHNIFQIFTMQAVLYTTVSGLPLPGAIGISESVFLGIFGVAFGEKLLSGAMLLNRGITFYWYVIVSLVIVIINAIRMKNVKGEIDEEVIQIESEQVTT